MQLFSTRRIHKVQALSIKHFVIGCLEGVLGRVGTQKLAQRPLLWAGRGLAKWRGICAGPDLRPDCIREEGMCSLRVRSRESAPSFPLSRISRVTDPRNFLLTGLPPKDLWEDVALAWQRAGLNVDECWKRALSVTNLDGFKNAQGVFLRFCQVFPQNMKTITFSKL